ncbi:MAG: hypothetical protein EFKGCFLK_01730 [Rhodocyclaceae bacterium]|nr:hypothetical protein [Rhodocyclaceae bacterium]CAG0933005.1 hypothetical protein RHDC3_02427 [Rhodocyclaceae bacterium]
MGKLILLLFLGLLAYLAYKGFRRLPRSENRPPSQVSERMVTCARCGVHLPESEAVQSDGRLYCSEEHCRLGAP